MRCIEIKVNLYKYHYKTRLTLTWDVLKLSKSDVSLSFSTWLTLTWDVLKFGYKA